MEGPYKDLCVCVCVYTSPSRILRFRERRNCRKIKETPQYLQELPANFF